MAIRNDIQINWEVSPRVVTINSPSVECTMQDLLDTLRYQESLSANVDNQTIIIGSGKVVLDNDGNAVGLTVQLIDAVVGFETRPGPTWVECSLNGGNLSGLEQDEITVTTVVTKNNPFVNINKTSSVSATFAENNAIQFASYNAGVTIDENNVSGRAVIGTEYPAGTEQTPCLLLTDAYNISIQRGFNKVYVKGDLALDEGQSWIGYEFIGESPLKSLITVSPIADVFNCEFYSCNITGTLDGNSQIEKSIVNDIDFVDGFIFECTLGPSVITLGTYTVGNFFNCFSTVPGVSTPTIDLNGTGILALRNYFGGMLLRNYNGSGSHSIDLSSGQVKLDTATITSGTFVVRGVGKLVDELGNLILSGTWNGGVTIVNELLNKTSIADAVWDKTLPV